MNIDSNVEICHNLTLFNLSSRILKIMNQQGFC
jgi:hypothetical protein